MKKMSKEWLVVFIHLGIVVIASVIAYFLSGFEPSITLCAGGGVSLLTLVGVVWMTQRVIEKKPIALTASSIVIKYALLGGILYFLTQNLKMDIFWLGIGVALILPSLFIFGLLSEKGLSEDYPDEEDQDV